MKTEWNNTCKVLSIVSGTQYCLLLRRNSEGTAKRRLGCCLFLVLFNPIQQILHDHPLYAKNWAGRCCAAAAAAAAKSLQSCPTLCDPIDSSPPGSPVPGILQARTLEWVAISFSDAWKWKVKVKSLGRVQLLATPWTAAHQAPRSMAFSRQEYWSVVPLPSPGRCYRRK